MNNSNINELGQLNTNNNQNTKTCFNIFLENLNKKLS